MSSNFWDDLQKKKCIRSGKKFPWLSTYECSAACLLSIEVLIVESVETLQLLYNILSRGLRALCSRSRLFTAARRIVIATQSRMSMLSHLEALALRLQYCMKTRETFLACFPPR